MIMGCVYEATIRVEFKIQYESPEGEEAVRRANDLPDILLAKLPRGTIYRSLKDGPVPPNVAGKPRIVASSSDVIAFDKV